MAEFFRFRSIDALLEKFQELEKQTIYFASPEELNDPMEGLRDIVWNGDEIVWTKFFKHYVFCLHWTYFSCRVAGDSIELDVDNIPISGRWDELPTPQAKDLFNDIWGRFCNLPNVQMVIEGLANRKRKIRYREIEYYLQHIHFVLLDAIQKAHMAHGLMSKFKIPQLSEELTAAASMKRLLNFIELTETVENERILDAIFQIIEITYDDIMLTQQYNSRTISTNVLANNRQLVIYDFPKVYVEKLEKLLWPKWYTTCFTKGYNNSSVWGKYADSHKGACLIFESVETDDLNSLKLKRATGSTRIMPFREVNYTNKLGEIDFFRNICRSLPVAALMELWYVDKDGNVSECASHIGTEDGEAAWRKSYWDNFFRDITIKIKDWSYEQEYRLVLEDGFSDFDRKDDRILTYDFASLKGIIFGINTSTKDKLKIIEIIKKKCKKSSRTEFKFLQAYYSSENGEICMRRINLPFCKASDVKS